MRRSSAAIAAAFLVLAAGAAGAPGARAAGGGEPSFAEVFGRATLVVVATVASAPPADDAFRLDVETVLKGTADPVLTFPAEATSISLTRGSRVLILAMDPASLDFRGTTALVIGADGTIDPDGIADVPPTMSALLAAYGPVGSAGPGSTAATGPAGSAGSAAATAAPTATGSDTPDPGIPWPAVVALAGVAVAAAVVVAVGERRRG